MQHNAYIQYFLTLAERHHLVLHNAQDPALPSGKRVSFFRMNNEWEMQQALNTQVDFPCLCLPQYRGRLKQSEGGGVISDLMTGFFEVRAHVDDPLDFTQIEAARSLCKQIGLELIAFMIQQAEDDGACGPIEDFNPDSVQYDFTGPVNQNEYGCLFLFEFQDLAFNALTADLSNVFL